MKPDNVRIFFFENGNSHVVFRCGAVDMDGYLGVLRYNESSCTFFETHEKIMFSSVKSAFLSVRRAPPYDGEMSMTDELVKKRGGGKPKEPPADIV